MATPGTKLSLTDDELTRLGQFLVGWSADLESEHGPLEERIRNWWKLYEAEPRSQVRTFPWHRASNVVMPLCRTWGGTIIARHFARLTSLPEFWTASTENEQWRDILSVWMPYQNWAARGNVFDMFITIWDVLNEMIPIGSSHFALSWTERKVLRYTPTAANTGKPALMVAHRGPKLEHVPREDLLLIPGRSAMDSEIVVRRRWMTRSELLLFAMEAGLDDATVDEVLKAPDDTGARAERDRAAGYSGSVPMWDIREGWVDYPLIAKSPGMSRVIPPEKADTSHPPVPILVTFHRGSGKVLRAMTHPYFFPHKPFYDVHFDKRAGRADSLGVAQMGEHLQRAASTMFNQAIDAVTLANSIKIVTTDKRLADFRFAPNRPIIEQAPNSIRELSLSKQVVPDLALINAVIAAGERVFSVGDPALGRETRLGGHPSPATSTLAMLEQLAINVSVSLRFMRHRLGQIGEDIATLFQQYETDDDGRVTAAVGFQDAKIIKELVLPMDEPFAGNVHFDVSALSEVQSPEAERAKVVLEDQMLTNYYSQLLGAAQILQTPAAQDPFVREIVMTAIRGKTLTMQRFLATTNYDNVQEVLVQLENSRGAQLELLQRTIGQLGGAGGPGVGQGTVPVPGMGPGPPSPLGPNGGAPPGAGLVE